MIFLPEIEIAEEEEGRVRVGVLIQIVLRVRPEANEAAVVNENQLSVSIQKVHPEQGEEVSFLLFVG